MLPCAASNTEMTVSFQHLPHEATGLVGAVSCTGCSSTTHRGAQDVSCLPSGRFITVLLFYWKNNTHKPPVISPHEITRPAMGAVCIYLLRSFLHHLPTFLKLSTSHRGPNCMARLSLRPRNPGQRKTVKNKGSCLSQVPAHWSQLLCDKNPLKQNLFENGLHLETFNKIVSF